MNLTPLAALLCLPALAQPSTWTPADTRAESVYLLLHAADWAQTLQIADSNGRWQETNPLLGRRPSRGEVNAYFAATAVAHVLIARQLSPEARRWFQGISIGVEAGCVGVNFRAGVRF